MVETIQEREARRNPTIRLHVTHEEREFLAFLVRRFSSDCRFELERKSRTISQRAELECNIRLCEDILVETEQAGT